MQEEHDLKYLRYGHQQARESQKVPLEPCPKLVDPLLVTLLVVEERQQGSERVGDGGGAEVVLEYLEHLETPIVVGGASVLKEKPGGAILQSRPELPLPELTGKGIHRVCDEGGIQAASGKARAAQPIKDQIPRGGIIV